MSYTRKSIARLLSSNPYPGRGIIVGKSSDGKKAMFAYFIMGRSENSRNRVFVKNQDEIFTEPFDESKVEDPSLIIYAPVKTFDRDVIVTNGDQTDTIEAALIDGKCFRHALMTREFEPDAPNFTPRISAILHLGNNRREYGYEMSILKSADGKGSACNRYFYSYEPLSGVGHFLHTYAHDGSPLPSFEGEPTRVKMPATVEQLAKEVWDNLNEDNKISLVCRSYDLTSGETREVLINKHTK